MKKQSIWTVAIIVMALIVSRPTSCQDVPGPFVCPEWQKIQLNTNDVLTKIIVFENRVIVFSEYNAFVSINVGPVFAGWKKYALPGSRGGYSISPVVFKGKIYITGKGILHSSIDGKKWQATTKMSPTIGNIATLAANEKQIFAFTNNTDQQCWVSEDGEKFEILDSFTKAIGLNRWTSEPRFLFAKAKGDTIIAASFSDMERYNKFSSYDNGQTWTKRKNEYDMKISDISFRDDQKMAEVGKDEFGAFFVVLGFLNVHTVGGQFTTIETTKTITDSGEGYDTWLGGYTLLAPVQPFHLIKAGGIISKNGNIEDAFLCPEAINDIKKYGDNLLIAVGDRGVIYVRPIEGLFARKSIKSPSFPIPSLVSPNIKIYPNPTYGELNLEGLTPGKTVNVYNELGAVIFSFTPQSEKQVINLNLSPGIYFLEGKKIIRN